MIFTTYQNYPLALRHSGLTQDSRRNVKFRTFVDILFHLANFKVNKISRARSPFKTFLRPILLILTKVQNTETTQNSLLRDWILANVTQWQAFTKGPVLNGDVSVGISWQTNSKAPNIRVEYQQYFVCVILYLTVYQWTYFSTCCLCIIFYTSSMCKWT